jgi:alkanesulfonate monooxygenase SsuD/methylene tetrahydromethanopterin reductase-like flavin-dependent oxidoreductase (luciferase family)
MRVGIYADLRNPAPWQKPWDGFYGAALERFEGAEALGLDSVWLTEHHGFADGYLPQPLTFAAAIATRTKKVRIGMAILLAALRPAQDIAEQAAVVDILSDGRLELGFGAGWSKTEFAAFGVDIADRYTLIEQRANEIRELWASGGATPPPVQDDLPIWIGGFGPRAARIAGRTNSGLLWLDRDQFPHYTGALDKAGHDPARARLGGAVNLVLSDDPERDWPRIAPHLQWQYATYAAAAVAGADEGDGSRRADELLGEGELDPETLRSPGPVMNPPAFDVVTADEALRRIRTWLDGLPVTDIFFWDSIAGMPDDIVQRHIELLATEIRPAVAELGVAA